jgi:hypothetical protein
MVCMRWTIAEKLAAVELPTMVRVSINSAYIGEINYKFIVSVLDGLTYKVGDVITLSEAWSLDDYSGSWFDFDPIVLLYSSEGWIGGSGYVVESTSDEPKGALCRTSKYSRALSEFKYAKSDRRHGSGSFSYYKRVEARASRRNDRALLEEAMSEVNS